MKCQIEDGEVIAKCMGTAAAMGCGKSNEAVLSFCTCDGKKSDPPRIEHFGSWLRTYRMAVGYGLREFAREMNCSAQTLSAMERGQRGIPKSFDFIKAAKLLGIQPGSHDEECFFAYNTACRRHNNNLLEMRVTRLEKELAELKESIRKPDLKIMP